MYSGSFLPVIEAIVATLFFPEVQNKQDSYTWNTIVISKSAYI